MQTRLKNLARELSADIVGFSDVGFSPIEGQPSLHYAVTVGVKLSDAVLNTIVDGPTYTYFHHYRTANTLLDQITYKLTREIERLGYNAFPVAASQSLGKDNPYAGVIPHKTAAVLSGIGFVGKSGLFISRDYGSKVRLATVLTDMPLTPEHPVITNGCGECNLCRDACPAHAIFGTLPTDDGRNYDPKLCSDYMKEHFQLIGRGSVCGVCIKVCPYNKLI